MEQELKFTIFDNDGNTCDRYTIIFDNGDVYGFDENPFHPLGFGQFSHDGENYEKYIETAKKEGHLGEIIQFEDLTEKAQQYVNQLKEGYNVSEAPDEIAHDNTLISETNSNVNEHQS